MDEDASVRRSAIKTLVDVGLDSEEAEASVRWLLRAAKVQGGKEWQAKFEEFISRRKLREPVQYIVGTWPFYPLSAELRVQPPVLIPRPETEELVDWVIAWYANQSTPRRILDVGCGTGAIVLALLSAFPSAVGTAIDPNPTAVNLTRENALRCGVAARLEVMQAAVEDAWHVDAGCTEQGYDLIVSNPPYIPSAELEGLQAEVRCFEDQGALDGGSDGLDVVQALLLSAKHFACPGAQVFMELHHTHPSLFQAIADGAVSQRRDNRNELLHEADMHLVGTASDTAGHQRFVQLSYRKRSQKPGSESTHTV